MSDQNGSAKQVCICIKWKEREVLGAERMEKVNLRVYDFYRGKQPRQQLPQSVAYILPTVCVQDC